MPHKPYKHKILLDEGMYLRRFLPRSNSRHNIKHIEHDLHQGGILDPALYTLAAKLKRIIVTYNINDFKALATKSENTGVIGVTQGLSPEQLDKKLNALLSKTPPKLLYGKYIALSGQSVG